MRARDAVCIYCGDAFGSRPGNGSLPSWEHIINDETIITRENIALCCRSCNSSKGTRPLVVWLAGGYCQRRGITKLTVAEVAKKALRKTA